MHVKVFEPIKMLLPSYKSYNMKRIIKRHKIQELVSESEIKLMLKPCFFFNYFYRLVQTFLNKTPIIKLIFINNK